MYNNIFSLSSISPEHRYTNTTNNNLQTLLLANRIGNSNRKTLHKHIGHISYIYDYI